MQVIALIRRPETEGNRVHVLYGNQRRPRMSLSLVRALLSRSYSLERGIPPALGARALCLSHSLLDQVPSPPHVQSCSQPRMSASEVCPLRSVPGLRRGSTELKPQPCQMEGAVRGLFFSFLQVESFLRVSIPSLFFFPSPVLEGVKISSFM